MAVLGYNPPANYRFMSQFDRCKVNVVFSEPAEGTKYRNLLVSVNGRSSNCTFPLDLLEHEFLVSWGSVVFIRLVDKGATPETIAEGDFFAAPTDYSIWTDGLVITLTNVPGVLHC